MAASADAAKAAAAEAAADLVEDGMLLGLGTGSTVGFFLVALSQRDRDVAGVPTSVATAHRCRELGIRLVAPDEVEALDLCVDGADELTTDLSLTKGGGGALLRERVVATMAHRMVVVATADKLVDQLGDSFPLPVEVVPFAVAPVTRRLEALGFVATLRRTAGPGGTALTGDPGDRADPSAPVGGAGDAAGRPGDLDLHAAGGPGSYRTDNGNAVLDCRFAGGIPDPAGMDRAVDAVPGVVGHGLFIGIASAALLASPDGDVDRLGTI